jgi:SAM-dependent methyltransferase
VVTAENLERRLQSFYEQMPYPAPLTNLEGHLGRYKDSERRRVRSLLIFPTGEPCSHQNILVAGCGTSQAAIVAIREPHSLVTAIDISGASLQHLGALQQKYALENLQLRQLSILDVRTLEQVFDQIICTGVLHHLPDPDLGLRCLRAALKPSGAMQIMVYASYGRAGIYMMQQYCRLLDIAPSPEALRALAGALKRLPLDHPIAGLLRKAKDFTDPDALADALLHPQDRSYTVPELYEWLDRCGMTFGRWYEQAPYLPQCGIVATSPHAARLSALTEPAQHAAVELFRGTMTRHSFVAYRDDYSGIRQPIQFTGEQWRSHVPIRLPWTVFVQEGAPTGSVGVLLNPAHKHFDLVLPINSAEASLLQQIDGKQTLEQILRSPAASGAAQSPAAFFEKLWRYDQIVFDATPTRQPIPSATN